MGDWGVSSAGFAELHWRGPARVYVLLPTDMGEPPWLRDAGFAKVWWVSALRDRLPPTWLAR